MFAPGDIGVFDPGINAPSILTGFRPPTGASDSHQPCFPANCDTAIAASLAFSNHLTANFDWRQIGVQTSDIDVESTEGNLTLGHGGAELETGDGLKSSGLNREYPALSTCMITLLAVGKTTPTWPRWCMWPTQ